MAHIRSTALALHLHDVLGSVQRLGVCRSERAVRQQGCRDTPRRSGDTRLICVAVRVWGRAVDAQGDVMRHARRNDTSQSSHTPTLSPPSRPRQPAVMSRVPGTPAGSGDPPRKVRIRAHGRPGEPGLPCHPPSKAAAHFVENVWIIVCLYVSPGRRTTGGKSGLFGESG